MKNKRARVLLIYTGGTIGMAPQDDGNRASPLVARPLRELMEFVPQFKSGLLDVGHGIELEFIDAFDEPLDSCDVTPKHWMVIARMIKDHSPDFTGFVVLHGTDTMAYTSSALAFIFKNLRQPVVVTGSQLPLSDVRTDAIRNLTSSVHVAGYPAVDLPCIPEVVICFHDEILRGCRATKENTAEFDGFESPNFPTLGRIGEHFQIREDLLAPRPSEALELLVRDISALEELGEHVLDVALFPGMSGPRLEQFLRLPKVRGLLLRTFGAGNAPSDPEFLAVIERAVRGFNGSRCHILNVTQCFRGMVEMGLYAASNALLERGVISGLDMTKEAAFAKLHWALSTRPEDQVDAVLQASQRGEQSLNLVVLRYGAGRSVRNDAPFVETRPRGGLPNEPDALRRAVVRFSKATFSGLAAGSNVLVNLFVNQIRPPKDMEVDVPECVGRFLFSWQGKETNVVHDVTDSLRAVLPHGSITLSVVPQAGVEMSFDDLHLALYTKAPY